MNKRFRLSVFLVIFNLFSIYTFADEFDDPGFPFEGDPGNEPPQTFINHYIIPLVVLAIIVGWYFTKSKQSKKI